MCITQYEIQGQLIDREWHQLQAQPRFPNTTRLNTNVCSICRCLAEISMVDLGRRNLAPHFRGNWVEVRDRIWYQSTP